MSLLAALLAVGVGCGGGQPQTTLPNEEADLDPNAAAGAEGTAELPVGLDGSTWRFVEASCTGGAEPTFLEQDYRAEARLSEIEGGIRLMVDADFEATSCAHTFVLDALLPESGRDLRMEETVRVAVPSSPECYGTPQPPRTGTLTLDEQGRLDVRINRNLEYCNGFEIQYVFDVADPHPLTANQVARRYAVYFVQGDADAMAALFADGSYLLEPFHRTPSGEPFRHDGKEEIQTWFQEAFAATPWRALRVMSVGDPATDSTPAFVPAPPAEEGDEDAGEDADADGDDEASEDGAEAAAGEGDGEAEAPAAAEPAEDDGMDRIQAVWEYMDPLLAEPFRGRTRFTILGGSIFEARIELTSQPTLKPPPPPSEGEGEGEVDSDAEESSES
ncbi:MAG: hypothetical protein ACFCGT_11585 [Sandaracinaceae bacterium]